MRVPKKSVLATALGAICLAGAAAAQQPQDLPATPAEPPQTDAAGQLDQIVVVGSRISGTANAGMLPVNVLDEEAVEATGAQSGEDLLRSLPQVGDMMFDNTDTAANLNAARGDVGSINLRNLGTGNTLLLVNGRRTVAHPGTQTENLVPRQTANVNAVPLYGVRRTEVLLGGASAIYGSDAVAGVLNVVMDTTFQGLQAQVQYGGSENIDLREGTFSIKAGQWFNDGRTRVTLLGGHTYRNRVPASEHPITAHADRRWMLEGTPWEGNLNFDNNLSAGPWGAFVTTNGQAVSRNGSRITNGSGAFSIQPEENRCVTGIGDGLCINSGAFNTTTDRPLRFNPMSQRDIFGGIGRTTLFGTLEQDIDDNFVAFGELSYYRSRFDGMREAAAPLAAAPIIVSKDNYWNPFGALYRPDGTLNPNRLSGIDAPEEGLDLRITSYRPIDVPRPYEVDDESYRFLAGVRGELWGMDWESAVLYSRAETVDTQNGSISNTLFTAALARSDADAYNPFNGGDLNDWSAPDATPSSAASIASFTVPVVRRSTASLFQIDTRFVKSALFSLPAGDVGVAFGAEWRRETLTDDRDPRFDGTISYVTPITGAIHSDVLGASPAGDNSGSRNVGSLYTEFAVPLVSRDMGVPLVRSLDMQLAGRYEDYSDFGGVSTPKLALSWTVFDGLMLRANWGRNFLAPNIIQINAEGSLVSNTRTDYYQCEADLRAGRIATFGGCGRSFSVQEERSGNRDLQPEESESTAVGLVFQPAFLPERMGEFTFTVDYWKIYQEGVIGILGGQVQLALDYLARMQGSSNPNVLREDPTEAQIADFAGTGLTPVGNPSLVQDQYINRLPRTTRGIDFSLNWRLRTSDFGTFNVTANASRQLERMQEPTPDEQVIWDAQQAGLISSAFRLSAAGNLVGVNGSPEWRGVLNTSWRGGDWLLGTHSRYVGPFESSGATIAAAGRFQIPSWTTHDVFVERRFGDTGNLLSDSRIRLTVRNVADRDPPITTTPLGFYASVHNIRGRGYYLTLTKRFD
ncbi:MAG: TonB-dependent receptor [Pseudoxanthomonas suwonensis]|nr:TonB-dependent receptor [Pseudoxanthomonas suwonensis]